jgi:formylglycine-generating enzyme required for sulfatase activity
MGSKKGEKDEKPVHSVTLSDFLIGKYEVTQAQWESVMGNNPSNFKGANLPVEQVSWDDIQEFLNKLSKKTGKTYKLPTEAQWEFAAGGGVEARFIAPQKHAGTTSESTLGNFAWYANNSNSTTHPVGSKQPNALGLYDMSGNVWEWCSDGYGEYSGNAQTNPAGASTGSNLVLRGGGWDRDASYCRVSHRRINAPSVRGNYLGFRVVLVP